jgi:hypothetical protein
MKFGAWRVAMNRAAATGKITKDTKLGRHLCTDEVFVLLEGAAAMLVAEGTDAPENIRAVKMIPHRLYNVRQGAFHQLVPTQGARLLIVENEDTSGENSMSAPIGEAQIEQVLAQLRDVGAL